MTNPEHLIPFALNDRGIRTMPSVITGDGDSIRVAESSSYVPHLWLTVIDETGTSVRVHLPIDRAQQVSDQLAYLVANHYQAQE